jgi:hypothetical protein
LSSKEPGIVETVLATVFLAQLEPASIGVRTPPERRVQSGWTANVHREPRHSTATATSASDRPGFQDFPQTVRLNGPLDCDRLNGRLDCNALAMITLINPLFPMADS